MNKTNVYGKLSKIRFELQNKKLKKSGHNKFAGFKYYELGDILPTINELSDKYGVVNIISYNREEAILEIIDIENSDSRITIKSPNLYLTAYEIVESDYLDAIQGKSTKKLLQAIRNSAKIKNKSEKEIQENLEKKYNKKLDKLNNEEIRQATEQLEKWLEAS